MPLGPISKLPLGILGFFGIKTLGVYPNAISDTIQLDLDQWGLLSAAHAEDLFSLSNAIGALNFNTSTLIVPQTEIWRVQYLGMTLFSNTTGTATLAAGFLSTTGIAITLGEIRHVLTAGSQQFAVGLSADFYLAPGDQLGVHVDAFTNAPTFHMYVRAARLRI